MLLLELFLGTALLALGARATFHLVRMAAGGRERNSEQAELRARVVALEEAQLTSIMELDCPREEPVHHERIA